ncbi:MAG: HAD family phosphatase [Chloroflexi bacterium]|nr:HAD family phosphatase [Chloroflexota bacterium]
MTIKAVLFDCGGVVLRPQDNGTYQRWEAQFGYQPGELAQKLWSSDAYRRAEVGQLSEDAFWAEIAPTLPLNAPGQIERLRSELWDVFTPNPDVLAWVERLHAWYKVAILSNATEILDEMLRNHFHIADRFDAVYNSAHLGVAKPDAAIYNQVLRSLKIAPTEALFIDDRAENIAAAARLGMHVLWYVGDQELSRQLQVYIPQEN